MSLDNDGQKDPWKRQHHLTDIDFQIGIQCGSGCLWTTEKVWQEVVFTRPVLDEESVLVESYAPSGQFRDVRLHLVDVLQGLCTRSPVETHSTYKTQSARTAVMSAIASFSTSNS